MKIKRQRRLGQASILAGGRERERRGGTRLVCIALLGSPVFQKDRQGLERALRAEHSTEAATPCAQVFLLLPLLALEGRLHHPHLSSVASVSMSNSCSLDRQLLLLQ